MSMKKTSLERILRPNCPGSNIPPYLIAMIGAAAFMMQGGVWAAMAVFVIVLVAAAAIEIFRR